MKKLNIESIESVEIDLRNGFAYAADSEGNNLFQVCLMMRVDGKGFKKVIDSDDCGYDWGMCANWNDTLCYENLEDALNVFLKAAKKTGVKVI